MKSPDPYQTRPSLLRRVKDRDESGWLHFYQQYRPLILWMMSRRGLYDRASTDTVIQAVMLHFAKLDWDYDSDRGRFRNLVLKVTEFKDITFRLLRLEAKPALRAIGMLKIAGVEREVAFDLKTAATATALTVTGEVPILMTDYGIPAPKAMMGMLKVGPGILVKFEAVLASATTF